MSLKIINITIPNESILPDIIDTFSPEENYIMLKIGCETLCQGRKTAANMSNNEIYKKIEGEFKIDIEKLNREIEIEKTTSLKMQEKVAKIYELQIEQLNKRLEKALSQIEVYKQGISTSLNEEVNKVKMKCDLLLEEKDRQNQLNREAFDKATLLINKSINKSSISIGDDGEQIFENLADTFKDFYDYKIENKAKENHKGDFHLFFKDFNVLVDSKNYTTSISKKEIVKIESDLNANANMNFAWLVSLNSNICEYNKFPIMTKWITTDDSKLKCTLMINNLLDNKEPRNMLRQAWQICNEIYRLTKKVDKEDGELEEYREKNLVYKKHIENLQERAHELRRSMNVSNNILKNIDNDLLEFLSLVSNEMISQKFNLNSKVKEWWNLNLEYTDDDNKITSTELWNKFKKENKEIVGENNVTIEKFKDLITGFVNSSNYIEKTKKGAIEFVGFTWKQIEIEEIENLEIENIVVEKVKNVKKENIKKISKFCYFDKEKDKKMLDEYNEDKNDIIVISELNNIRPWEVVSLLMKYKVINSRGEARGYDKYKETDEYKSKIKE
jgi:hypothetical protein